MQGRRTEGFSHLALGLALYLLFFSAAALFHAYANDELVDSHGCQIGLWVQHAQAAVVAILLVPATLVPALLTPPVRRLCYRKPCRSTALLRGPPRLLSL